MPFLHHAVTTLRIITKPSVVVPNLTVRSVANINFKKLRDAGYEGVVIDRDNCLTKPRQDDLVPSLKDAWADCHKAFGPDRILIVSNSAGTSKDASFLQAEALTRNLGAPVLLHEAPKPWVVKPILHYFADLPPLSAPSAAAQPKLEAEPATPRKPIPPRLLVIGDRISTDILLGSRLQGSFSIWTKKVWQEESFGVRVARLLEDGVLFGVTRWRVWRRKRRGLEPEVDTAQVFVKNEPVVEEPAESTWWNSIVSRVRGLLPKAT
ncbi:hypothetical protein CALCODRAFT_516624 [Calocera cornea HHB12733]|uniref:HAD-superfamily phosphatase n=1 Tax=Calocera cornea HHB12733 TaxID=1353952 RepID=A0A165H003_9BASI|nr:hypothetical protein CALCODRAFT_516624 [Calocera cornea HHB12733]